MKHRILIVEDNSSILDACCEYLSRAGYDVEGCSETKDAERRISQRHFSIVLSDVRLRTTNDYDGLALAEFINEHCPGTPMILLTACGDPEMHLRAVRAGVIRVLNKPQSLARIASVIDDILLRAYGVPAAIS